MQVDGSNQGLRLLDDGTERLRITSAGEVRQQSTGGSTIYELKRSDANTTGAVGTINYTASDGHSVASMSAIGDGDNEGAHLVFRTTSAAANNSPYNAATPERLRIDSSGRVLISGQASLTSTSLPHPVQIAADSDAQNIACFGRASDDISAIDFYEADKTTNLGEIQYRQDHVNFRHRVGDIVFCSGGVAEKLRIVSTGELRVPAGIGAQLRFRNQHGHTGDAVISTYDDAVGTLLCLGSNFYYNSSGSETRYNTSEESAGIVINRTGTINFNTGGTSATAATRLTIDSDGRLLAGGAVAANAWAGGDDLIIGNTTSGTRSGITLVSGSDTDGGLYWSDGNSGTTVLKDNLFTIIVIQGCSFIRACSSKSYYRWFWSSFNWSRNSFTVFC